MLVTVVGAVVVVVVVGDATWQRVMVVNEKEIFTASPGLVNGDARWAAS